jgi:DNA-binding GntR family transcriptional regulator
VANPLIFAVRCDAKESRFPLDAIAVLVYYSHLMVYQMPESLAEGSERDRAYDQLIERILDGRLAPSERLVEAALSEEFGLSRTPLREALFLLQREGFVETKLRRGFSVRPLSEREAREIYTIVAHLEILAVRESWPQIISLCKELRAINKRFLAVRTTPRRAVAADQEFHRHLVSRCPNDTLVGILQTLHRHVLRYEYLHMSDDVLAARSAAQHDEIIAGLERQHLDDACEAIAHNYREGIAALQSYLRTRNRANE